MPIESVITNKSLRMTNNYGVIDGKVLRKTKTYGHVSPEATNENILNVYNTIDSLQNATAEICQVVTTTKLTEVNP
ncbi:MAG: hypothetical protein GX127_09485 [Eubacteriaceae bacterium]|jgi:hypothetical protein|nr:hypothetical protein [Eubacteriaceae bacterium]